MSKKLVPVLVVLLIVASLIAGCAQSNTGTTSGKIKVFGAYATPIEEPWDGVIHQALNAAKDAGSRIVAMSFCEPRSW